MRELLVLTACLGFFLLYLAAERVRLDRALRRVPRRVAVTGTRGKSGITRLVAAGLRASGAKVLAKTTGSKPVLILPDGSEREIIRTGPASVREQVRLVELAASSGAGVLVVEMMSIGAECLAAESERILRPQTLAVTNVRLDHLDEMGGAKDEIARTMAAAIPRRADVFVPAEELQPAFEEAAARQGSRVHVVPKALEEPEAELGLPLGEFEPNRRLARAVLGSMGLDNRTIERGFAAAVPDAGSLRIWRGTFGVPPLPAVCVSLFAANEPESSAAALLEVERMIPMAGRPLVGLLSLREDRGDRTLQWVRAAGEGFFRGFSSVFLLGPPARAAIRKIRRRPGPGSPIFDLVESRSAEDVMSRVLSSAPDAPIVVGLGNFVGPGDELVRYWEGRGTAHDR
ncbi:MAG: poly-gamma-glutamate synthase PgsB [Candidatus Aminicenantales bacterium]